ncbi:acetyl-CoA hydrolase [Xanthomonas oryzae pv. oryzicola]|nr:acetyl-CoA hydrolase [Xanthomonas oryzae pv. oryzicola]
MSTHVTALSTAVSHILQRIDGPLRVGAPLGIGKPHRLLNALYAQLKDTPSRPLAIYTALSLNPPKPGSGLEARFAAPFIARHFGDDFPRLAYVDAMLREALPAHVQVEEFYMQSGGLLHSPQTQAD